MASQLSPFVEANYGWPFGSSGWNDEMDQNLVKFSYLHDRNIDAIVSSLPAISNGSAYFNTADSRLYFDVNGQRYSSVTPKWFEVTLRSTGEVYLFDGATLNLTQRVSDFAADLAESTDPLKNAALIGFKQTGAGAVPRTLKDKTLDVGVYAEDFGAIGDGVTDNTSAINSAISAVAALGGGVVHLGVGTFLIADASSILINTANIELRGAGRESTAIINQPTVINLGVPLITVSADNFTLSGIRLNGGRAVAVDNKSTVNAGRFSLIAYDNTTRRGLKLLGCAFEDCRGKGVLFNANDTTIYLNIFRRIGRYVGDVTPIDSALTNWVLAGTPDNVVISTNVFEYIGMFGTALKNISNLVVEKNRYRFMSAIGAGFQGCYAPKVLANAVSVTFNSGIDLQQCRDPSVCDNSLDACGYGIIDPVTLGPRMYQAIFIGDDSTNNSTGDSLSVGGTLARNTIRGYYVSGGGLVATDQQTGCGITLVSTTGLTLISNTVYGIGDRSTATLVVDNKDGVGIKASNNNISLKIIASEVFDTKSDGIQLGVGDLVGAVIVQNVIKRHGRHGLNLVITTRVKSTTISENDISDGTNTQALAVAADIYLGISSGWLAGLTLEENKCYNSARDSVATAGATVFTTHGIYFKKLGAFAGLGTVLVADNLCSGHLTKEIAFSDVFTISGKARYFNAFANNRDGMTDNGTGIIFDIPNFPDVAIEFVATAAPTSGQFAQGSKVWYPFPVGSDYVGAVCVVSGNPGTWRKFGLISAVPG